MFRCVGNLFLLEVLTTRTERGVHTKKGKGILIIEGGKRRSTGIYRGSVEERIHLTFQVTSNVTSILYGKKG